MIQLTYLSTIIPVLDSVVMSDQHNTGISVFIWLSLFAIIGIEVWFYLTKGINQVKEIASITSQIRDYSQLIGNLDEESIQKLTKSQRTNPAINYLVLCNENNVMVDEKHFLHLMGGSADRSFSTMNMTINLLPVIGLMGTFLGITLGVLNVNFNDVPDAKGLEIKSLIDSAKLAFISSLVGLLLSSILRYRIGSLINSYNSAMNTVKDTLILYYIPRLAPKDTEGRFASAVNGLRRTINDFIGKFTASYSHFLGEFQPLIDQQTDNNRTTLTSMEKIVSQLSANTLALDKVTVNQAGQVSSFDEVTKRMVSAAEVVNSSMVSASENLQHFVHLGNEMKNNISSMHEPLEKIIERQHSQLQRSEDLTKEIRSFIEGYRIVQAYVNDLKTYISTLNDKMDIFTRTGETVRSIDPKIENFRTRLDELLSHFVDNANRFHKSMEGVFSEYSNSLSGLFDDVRDGDRNINLFIYDKKTLSELQQISLNNRQLIDTLQKDISGLSTVSEKLLQATSRKRRTLLSLFRKKK